MAPPRRAMALATGGCAAFLLFCRGVHAGWYDAEHLDPDGPNDHVALLQHGAQHHRRGAVYAGGRLQARADGALTPDIHGNTELFCAAWPELCKPPFNCQNFTDEDQMSWDLYGMAVDGKPNYKTWCTAPQYTEMISRCAAGNLVEAGQVQFALSEAGMFGGLTADNDGSYCFLEGHCVNTAVTENTTAEEAVQMCDERFGRDAWAQFGKKGNPPEDNIGYAFDEQADPRNGFTTRKQTRPYLLAACAMGNFHCDVVYCRETYCKKEYYIKKYSHFLKDLGWVK
uniref:Uncharacterized protein n=1 Tax=Alexandrium monilatum TaxID=311494 RepID=A0A7S4QTM5_9DINO